MGIMPLIVPLLKHPQLHGALLPLLCGCLPRLMDQCTAKTLHLESKTQLVRCLYTLSLDPKHRVVMAQSTELLASVSFFLCS